MNPQNWQQVKELFHDALERPPAEREHFLRERCGGEPGLLAQVRSLLSSDEEAGDFLIKPAFVGLDAELLADDADTSMTGRHIGSYEVVRELGRGGMGAVYLCVRADAQFDKQAAIKVVKRGMDTDFVLRRFRRERQVLAALEHPNIARLLDGGVTEDGRPYFVMEYVEGEPITEYCVRNRLGVTERLNLFRHVCSAVQYAHQNLVVHRDLKPSNILVTRDGTPKLLDFGIAKLLNLELAVETMDQTATAMRLMTPEYASPEQVRGLPVTTVSDVYSLGVLLYELLTGRRPYHLSRRSPEEIARTVCEKEPVRPSAVVTRTTERSGEVGGATRAASPSPKQVAGVCNIQPERLRRRLAGDLDNIVLKAMRKEPQRRYASAEQLAVDISRHLGGLPVTAQHDTFTYRAGKFIRRHRAGVAAAVLVALTLMAGVAATSWQARQARVERARAERRFNDVRRLANSFMFEFHDVIENLPGATPARELVVKRALEYLDSLAQETINDVSLQNELATAYRKVGDVQGAPAASSLGNTAAAIESYRKAIALREKVHQAEPRDATYAGELTVDYGRLTNALSAEGDTTEALEYAKKSLAISRELSAAKPGDLELSRNLGTAYYTLGELYADAGDFVRAVETHKQGLAVREPLPARDPSNWRLRHNLATSYNAIGRALGSAGDTANALQYLYRGLQVDAPLIAGDPNNALFWRILSAHYDHIFVNLKDTDPAKAAEFKQKGVALLEKVLAADPKDASNRTSLALGYMKLGKSYLDAKAPAQALAFFGKSLALYEGLAREDPNNIETQYNIAQVYMNDGDAYVQLKDTTRALTNYNKALYLLEPLTKKGEGKLLFNSVLANTYFRLGGLHKSLAERSASRVHWREARSWYDRSLGVYERMRENNMLQDTDDIKGSEDARRAVARCDEALAKTAAATR